MSKKGQPILTEELGIIYILCRIAGKYLGARLGATLGDADTVTRQWMGGDLLPQAGVYKARAQKVSIDYC